MSFNDGSMNSQEGSPKIYFVVYHPLSPESTLAAGGGDSHRARDPSRTTSIVVLSFRGMPKRVEAGKVQEFGKSASGSVISPREI
jgi:hypothetical protein